MKTIGRYIIKGLLGRGGMGKVFKVEIPVIRKTAALKLLDPDPLLVKLMGMDTLHRLFTQEAVIMARLQHSNVIGVNDFESGPSYTYYVMDYLADNLGVLMGESYRVESASRKLSVDKAILYTRQILEGLTCLHDAGIVHRDIKPYNLLVTGEDIIKICDFGMSKLRGETYAGPSNLNVGSPYYAAPEQIQAPDHVDARADIYAVGVILYRMLTGCLPDDPPLPPSRLNRELNSPWDIFILKALAPLPDGRFPDAFTMQDELAKLTNLWAEHKEMTCMLPEPVDTPPLDPFQRPGEKIVPRRQPIKIKPRQAAERFHLNHLWQPITFHPNRILMADRGLVRDPASQLIWQVSGSRFPLSWHRSREYIETLNQRMDGGISNWRLPTVEELMTLLRPVAAERAYCIPEIFDHRQRRIWSCDRSSFTAAYYIDIDLGFVGWQDFSAAYYVRAVCEDIFSAI